MRKLVFIVIVLVITAFLPAFAESGCGSAGCQDAADSQLAPARADVLILSAQGFAFKGKEFKTVRIGIKYDSGSKQGSDSGKGAVAAHPDGYLGLAGFKYALKIVTAEEGKIAADLFRMSDFEIRKDEKQDKLKLPVPIGHLTLTRSQPNPGSFVQLGTLRINDEETSLEGEFELYLNDLTAQDD
ncbi:MAG: hypothetical protein CVV42_00125 [Candidatus Riflebacteria bacterium HGW-Riflebacteria-2]|jgi:hypothetical protein|nr:MAG: hypothetical protein CVV42_00125 [Candidatus Riflebacteria bacterium HGW-Riflebacteria-2]